jgi:3-dehydroquinate synthetase
MDDETRRKFLIAIGGVFVLAIVIFLANAWSRGLL